MKLKKDYILRNIMNEYILIPVGSTAVNDSSISIATETGGIILTGLQNGQSKEEILKQILDAYDIDASTADADYEEFIQVLRDNDLIEE